MLNGKQHKHNPKSDKLAVDDIKQQILSRAAKSKEEPRTCISAIQRDMPLSLVPLMPSNATLARCINKQRAAEFGKEAESREEIEIPYHLTKTLKDEFGEQEIFLLADSGVGDVDRILLFACAKNLEWLSKYLEWYIDGTFDISPKLFKQLFTFQIIVNGFNLPLVYCLLPNKKAETYKRMFDMLAGHLDARLIKSRITWRCDFELGIWGGIKESRLGIRNTKIEACYFHLSSSVSALTNIQLSTS